MTNEQRAEAWRNRLNDFLMLRGREFAANHYDKDRVGQLAFDAYLDLQKLFQEALRDFQFAPEANGDIDFDLTDKYATALRQLQGGLP